MSEPRYCGWAGCLCVVCCQIEDACATCELRPENAGAGQEEAEDQA